MMKVLWLCNSSIPCISESLGLQHTPTGGWLVNAYNMLTMQKDITVIYVFPSKEIEKEMHCVDNGKNSFVVVRDSEKNIDGYIEQFEKVLDVFSPDLIHIWGTERRHAYAMVEAAKDKNLIDNVVISIQGLVSVYEQHYYAGIPGTVQLIPTLRDVLRRDSLNSQKQDFKKRGKYEQKAISSVKHVIGRTFWDYACVKQINPDVQYHYNNETMRSGFYQKRWDKQKCKSHTIFASQAQYPIKGFHYLLKAVSILKREFPDISLFVSGSNNAFKQGLLITAYGKYINKLIHRYQLEENVHYVGMLNEEQMIQQFLQAEVFVSASVIENSPNSVCEAMLLGMPVISSNVGGVADLLTHGLDGYLYQADAPYMLAYYIALFFNNSDMEEKMGRKAHEHALITHDKKENNNKLMQIYNEIAKEKL